MNELTQNQMTCEAMKEAAGEAFVNSSEGRPQGAFCKLCKLLVVCIRRQPIPSTYEVDTANCARIK